MKNKILMGLFLSASLYAKDILTISNAYNLGLDNASKIKSSTYQYKAMKERIKQQKSHLYPQLTTSITIGKNDYTLNKRQNRIDYNVGGDAKNLIVSLSQVVYNPSLNKQIDIQKIKTKLFGIKNEMIKQNFANEVLDNYIEILKSKNRIILLNAYINYYKSLLNSTKEKLNINLVNQMDVLDVEVKLETTKIQIEKEKELVKSYKNSLKYLTGVSDFNLPSGDMKYVKNDKLEEMLSVVNSFEDENKNLQYKQAIKGVELAKKELEEAKSGYLPTLNLQARYTKYNPNDETAYYDNTKTIALSLSLPIYQGGLVQSKIAEAKLNKLSALEDVKKVKKEIKIEYKKELSNFKSLVKIVKLYKKAYKSSKLYIKSVKKGYKSGLNSIVDVNNAKTKLNEVKFKYMQNLYDMLSSFVKLLIITDNMDYLVLTDEIIK